MFVHGGELFVELIDCCYTTISYTITCTHCIPSGNIKETANALNSIEGWL